MNQLMQKQNLFQLISKGEVVLWAGAGLSMYAGLPSGNAVAKSLYEGLTDEEKKLIDSKLLLPDLAEEIYRIKANSRNYIIQKLRDIILLQKYNSTETHKTIAKIPHFRNIVTTNYDKLFEDTFKENLEVIYNDSQIPFISDKKVNLFKIHGDLSVPDSVIITKSDYDNFFGKRTDEDVLWTLIKEKMATKTILFIGYNLEDSNVAVIFDRITQKLGANRKECFFVSPNIPPQKLHHLYSKNIHYINSTGEDLIADLVQYLKDNIKKDFENKNISSEIYSEFIRNFNLKSDLEISDAKNIIKNISGIEGDVKTEINFTVKKDHPEIEKFLMLQNGDFLDEVEIDKSAFTNWDHRMEGIKISGIEDIANLTVIPIPIFKENVDVVFDSGYEINDVEVAVFRGNLKVRLSTKFEGNEFELLLQYKGSGPLDIKINFKNARIINNSTKQLKFYEAMHHLTSGENIVVYSQGKIVFSTKQNFDVQIIDGLRGLNEYNLFYYDYFKKLKQVENLCKTRFSKIDIEEVNDTNDSYLDLIIAKFKKEPVTQNFNGISFIAPLTDENVEIFKSSLGNSLPFMMKGKMPKVSVHNQDFELGEYETYVVEPILQNVEEVLSGKEERLRIESLQKKAVVKFVG